jgi:hypothetical protein
MYPAVTKVSAQDNFVLYVEFDSGEKGVLDIKSLLDFGIFTRINSPENFNKVHVAFDTVEWDCGADLDPEFVYAHCNMED